MTKKLFSVIFLVYFSVYYSNLYAQTDDILALISKDMNHFNQVATTTKQNEHYQPYVISVFQGKDLEKMGITNLEEALGLVPGVDMTTDNMNIKTPIFRGSNPFAYGQSKLFIDGVLANNVFFDAYSEHLRIPVEMIKRIEIVRGPGSKNDGYNAFAGSINVITYAEDFKDFENKDKLVMKLGSYKYGMVGFVNNYKMDEFSLTTDFSYQRDDKTLRSGPDGYSQGSMSGFFPQAYFPNLLHDVSFDNRHLSNSGEVFAWSDTYSLGMTLNYNNNFYVKLRLLDHTQASAYGINLYITDDRKSRLKQPNHYLEFGYEDEIDNFEVSVKAGVKYDAFDSDAQLGPNGINFLNFYKFSTGQMLNESDHNVSWNNGIPGEHTAEQLTYYQSTFLNYNGLEDHNINLGYRISQEKTISMTSKIADWETGVGLTDYTDTFPFFVKSAERNIRALFIQDRYNVNNELSFLVGFNYEQTSYKNAGFEPKASMVYQPDMFNIYKVMYGQSHRNTSWQEMYTQNNYSRQGSTEFMPERVKAYEAAYIHKFSSANYLQANLFYLKNSDQIQIIDSIHGIFANSGDTTIYGCELEYKGNFTSKDILYMNYSYINGEENSADPLANVAKHMIKGYYTYDLNPEFSASVVQKYIGEKKRVKADARDNLKGYAKTDLTLRYDDRKSNFSVTGSVKNIFDSDIRFPSKPNTYIEDYYQEGRNFMITMVKEF